MSQIYATIANSLIRAGFGVFFMAVFAAQAVAFEAGFRLGLRQVTRHGRGDKDGVSTLSAAMLGVMGFTLGLTITFAETRFEARRASVLAESNAIGTAWLRAALLSAPDAQHLQTMIESYADQRLAFVEAKDHNEMARQTTLAAAGQAAMWTLASTAARASPTPIAASVIASLNAMIDAAQEQRFTFESELPAAVGEMLLIGSLLALGVIGYQLGLDRQRRTGLAVLLLVMWAGGIAVTADLGSPRIGQIRAQAAPLIWTIQDFHDRRTPVMYK